MASPIQVVTFSIQVDPRATFSSTLFITRRECWVANLDDADDRLFSALNGGNAASVRTPAAAATTRRTEEVVLVGVNSQQKRKRRRGDSDEEEWRDEAPSRVRTRSELASNNARAFRVHSNQAAKIREQVRALLFSFSHPAVPENSPIRGMAICRKDCVSFLTQTLPIPSLEQHWPNLHALVISHLEGDVRDFEFFKSLFVAVSKHPSIRRFELNHSELGFDAGYSLAKHLISGSTTTPARLEVLRLFETELNLATFSVILNALKLNHTIREFVATAYKIYRGAEDRCDNVNLCALLVDNQTLRSVSLGVIWYTSMLAHPFEHVREMWDLPTHCSSSLLCELQLSIKAFGILNIFTCIVPNLLSICPNLRALYFWDLDTIGIVCRDGLVEFALALSKAKHLRTLLFFARAQPEASLSALLPFDERSVICSSCARPGTDMLSRRVMLLMGKNYTITRGLPARQSNGGGARVDVMPWNRNRRKFFSACALLRFHRLLWSQVAPRLRNARVCFSRVMDEVARLGFETDPERVLPVQALYKLGFARLTYSDKEEERLARTLLVRDNLRQRELLIQMARDRLSLYTKCGVRYADCFANEMAPPSSRVSLSDESSCGNCRFGWTESDSADFPGGFPEAEIDSETLKWLLA